MQLYGVRKFPTLLVLSYNYTQGEFDQFLYEGPQFDLGGYVKMKEFLAKFALEEPRTDLMFHTIHMPKKSQLQTVDNEQDLWRLLDRSSGWTVIEYAPQPSKILTLKDKYGEYFSYVHYMAPESRGIKSYIPRFNETHDVILNENNEFLFRTMSSREALSNVSAYARQNYSAVIFREQYGHLCSISEQTFFRGILFCVILAESDYESFRSEVGSDVEYGVYLSLSEEGGDKMSVHKLRDAEFKNTYQTL